MYCPNCGSNNQAETKYCTRCGTNLGVVAAALSGKLSGSSEIEDRSTKLLMDYYRGRLSILVGVLALFAATLILILLQFTGGPKILNALSIAGIIYGAIATAWGVEKWNDSLGEISALGYTPAEMKRRQALKSEGARPEIEAPKTERIISLPGQMPGAYSTDPIAMPPSVTEQTTRELDERARQLSLESRPKEPR